MARTSTDYTAGFNIIIITVFYRLIDFKSMKNLLKISPEHFHPDDILEVFSFFWATDFVPALLLFSKNNGSHMTKKTNLLFFNEFLHSFPYFCPKSCFLLMLQTCLFENPKMRPGSRQNINIKSMMMYAFHAGIRFNTF